MYLINKPLFSENLTPFGKAIQSSRYAQNIFGPQTAIDPPISNEWGYDKCTHTNPALTSAWWMFNISYKSAFITDIKIYYREACTFTIRKALVWFCG